MKALVIGAAGFLGSNLVRALLARGDEVRAMVRPRSTARTLARLDVERIDGDLNDAGSLERACRGVRVVFQTASYYPSHTVPVKIAIAQALSETRTLLGALRQADVDRLVFTSTLTTIGFPPKDPEGPARLPNEQDLFVPVFPDNPYLMAKAMMEQEILQQAAGKGLPAVIVNPTVFYGPYDSKPTSGTQILMIARRRMPAYVQGPVNVIDVRDVADGMISAAERGRTGERYILGNWNTTQKELNAMIARVVGASAPILPIPFPVARYGSKVGDWMFRTTFRRPAPVPGFFVEMLRHMQQYDCSKAAGELGPASRPVDRAIADAASWFRENGYLPISASRP
jgi:dihydroflavonol-4-reductase